MPDRYALFGHPIRHSRSPSLFASFGEQTSQPIEYTKVDVAPGEFVPAVREFVATGGKGFNVTLPFKEEAYSLVHELTPRARQAGAVNAVKVQPGGGLLGDNTDGIGLVKDLRYNHDTVIGDARILLLGAGGAARGVIGPLLAEKPHCIEIANRTPGRAQRLARHFMSDRVCGGGYDRLGKAGFDLIINATAASLAGELPPLPEAILNPGATCYEMLYADTATIFMLWAEAQGATRVLDGWGMLVEQAAESFLLWRGIRPQTQAVLSTN